MAVPSERFRSIYVPARNHDGVSVSENNRFKVLGPRLEALYDFTGEVIGPVDRLLDIGSSTGEGFTPLSTFARSIDSIDRDVKKIQTSMDRPEAQSGQVNLILMDALEIATLEAESYDAVIAFGVLSMLKSPQAVLKVLSGAHQVLKPGGRLVFEIKGRHYLFAESEDPTRDGTAKVPMSFINNELADLFPEREWYGQIFPSSSSNGSELKDYVPRKIDPVGFGEELFDVGFFRKAA